MLEKSRFKIANVALIEWTQSSNSLESTTPFWLKQSLHGETWKKERGIDWILDSGIEICFRRLKKYIWGSIVTTNKYIYIYIDNGYQTFIFVILIYEDDDCQGVFLKKLIFR